MEITKIEQQKNNRKRYNLYLNDSFWLGVSQDILVKFNLKKGKQISKNEKAQIDLTEKIEQAWQKSLYYLSYQNRSKKEIVDYLEKKDFSKKVISKTIEKLNKYQYINDSQFLTDWVNNRISKGKGPRQIYNELLKKGFEKEQIEKGLRSCYDRDKQLKICLGESIKYVSKKAINLEDYKQRQRVFRFLGQRGFDYDIMKEVIKKILKN